MGKNGKTNKGNSRVLGEGSKDQKRLTKIVAKLTSSANGEKPRQRYFDEQWLAARWGCSVQYVRKMRFEGNGPTVTYFGRSVRYRLRHICAFERAHEFHSRSDKDVRG